MSICHSAERSTNHQSDPSFDILDTLDRAYATAHLEQPVRRPWIDEERQDIINTARKSLGIEDSRIPTISIQSIETVTLEDIRVEKIQAETWEGCKTAAYLYLPPSTDNKPLPTIMICCGHGKGGKQNENYRNMAWQLAKAGVAVLIVDNIGQGERTPMGHREVIGPFHYGISLQGMIVMESMAWLNWLHNDPRFDSTHIGTIGNSGGGTLTLFLAAFRPEQLALVASTGYPSSFAFIAQKEKDHCHCNILPGIVGDLEMWQLYGSYAPKPLLIGQGRQDPLFPDDIFNETSRRVLYVYQQRGAPKNLAIKTYPGGHPWDENRILAIRDYILKQWKLPPASTRVTLSPDPGPCYADGWPSDALNSDATAALITGQSSPVPTHLRDVFYPAIKNTPDVQLPRTTLHELVAQQIALLRPDLRPEQLP